MAEPAIAVGCIFEGSGMTTWCIEAAHALAGAGERVCLIYSLAVRPPKVASDAITLVGIEPRDVLPSAWKGRISREISRVVLTRSPFMRAACRAMEERGISAEAFMLSSTLFVDPGNRTPQSVVAWPYPPTFSAYMKKLPTHHAHLLSVDGIRTILDHVGFYRRDWFGYRHSHVVMSVSRRLHDALRAHGVRSVVVHPGTRLAGVDGKRRSDVTRLVVMAVDLDAPRKRIGWMLSALRDLPVAAELVMIGECSPHLRRLAEEIGIPFEITGRLNRDDALARVRSGDVFLFGSILDDWGYALLEGMANGLTVVAARMSPFDEIVGDMGYLYDPLSLGSFRDHVLAACQRRICDASQTRWLEEHFSCRAFGNRLQDVLHAMRLRPAPSDPEPFHGPG